MDLTDYRTSVAEQQRTADLLRMMPATGHVALDIGARDGHFSTLLADRFDQVVALDLTMPQVVHPRVLCVEGNAADLGYADASMDFVFCAEVLEHIPGAILSKVCDEIQRVNKGQILIGVPYKQDNRVGRTTCQSCGKKNPPWGHVNTFDEHRLAALFPRCKIDAVSFVGTTVEQTNGLSSRLMDWAGNPYGTYEQDEPCMHCGSQLGEPRERSLVQKGLTKLAVWSQGITGVFVKPRGNWIHVLLSGRSN